MIRINPFRGAHYVLSAHQLHQLPSDEGIEIAIAGRSNAGKSSAINAILNRRNFARTSKSPGRTQLINFFELDPQRRLVDLPGYGFARVPKKMRSHWDQVLSGFLLQRNALKGLVIVVDIRRGISELDQALFDMVESTLPIHVLLTKSDKLSRSAVKNQIKRTQQQIAHTRHTVSSLSTLNRQGLEQLEQRCKQWLDIE